MIFSRLRQFFASAYTWKLNLILERTYEMAIQLEALHTAVDSVLAKLSANAAVLAAVQADADHAKADLAALQAQVASDTASQQAAVDAITAQLTA